ncbi:hypothetical protein BKA66DRAFT_409999 [Pyrenochaeta sp. MPI-SDFR-AT-0127]|nr:hypothetical protein BKA66DRAFT_409999 [Pyrenochaeta sp. MPI-SDFR-AT-0127]
MGGRALITVVLSLMTFLNARALGSNLESRQLSLAEIPPCGIQCLFLTVPASGCGLEDFDCVCNNDGLTQTLAACMLANCTMADNLGTARVQADICNLSEESKRKEVFMYTGIVYSMAFLFVILRIAGKLVSKRLALDDWIVIAALLLAAVPLGCVLTMTKMGFGNHLWTLEDNTLLPILRFFFISWSTYVIVLGMIKVSLILFYLEIFKTRRFEISAYIILAYIIVNSLVIFFLTTFACTPVQSFWNQNIKGKCMDIQGLAYATSASAIVQDIMLLILPLVFIRNLQMKRYRKIAVGLMFTIGTFGCIATIIRLQTLLPFKISIDPTWDYVPLTVWTELELAAGFACVSLPSIRILIRLLAVKANEFLLHISARSRSNRTPKQELPAPQREWRKPWSWINVSLDINNSRNRTKGRQSFMRSLRSRNSMIPYTHHNTRSGSRRLEPTMSNYSESGVALTRPPFRNEQCERSAEQIEMLEFPSLASLRRDSHIRAVAIEASVPNKQIV